MRRLVVLALLAAGLAAILAIPATAKPRGINGKIVFNADNSVTGQEQVYTVDPDGTDLELLANDTEAGQWSPNGTEILISGGILNFDSGAFTDLSLGTLYPDLFVGCGAWSTDATRLACEVLDFTGPNGDRTGAYTVDFSRSSSTAAGCNRSRPTGWRSTSTAAAGRRRGTRSCSRPTSRPTTAARFGSSTPTAPACGRSRFRDAAASVRTRARSAASTRAGRRTARRSSSVVSQGRGSGISTPSTRMGVASSG